MDRGPLFHFLSVNFVELKLKCSGFPYTYSHNSQPAVFTDRYIPQERPAFFWVSSHHFFGLVLASSKSFHELLFKN